MSEIINDRLKQSIGKEATIFLTNGFRYQGKITNCDETYVEVLDYKTSSYKLIRIENINDADIKEGEK